MEITFGSRLHVWFLKPGQLGKIAKLVHVLDSIIDEIPTLLIGGKHTNLNLIFFSKEQRILPYQEQSWKCSHLSWLNLRLKIRPLGSSLFPFLLHCHLLYLIYSNVFSYKYRLYVPPKNSRMKIIQINMGSPVIGHQINQSFALTVEIYGLQATKIEQYIVGFRVMGQS